jgi:MFS transporter, MCT family, solute carrier family 16 (monocarboxylic acid transporters), member 14
MPLQNNLDPVKTDTNNEPKKNGTTKVIEKMEEELPTASVIIPPDGGWGWLVMMASFSCNVIVDGIIFSAGSILIPIQTSFGASKAETAFVTSLLSGFYLMAGPFVSALANKMGFRFVTVVGTFIAVIGFGLSYFATSIPYLYVTYGVIGGRLETTTQLVISITYGFFNFRHWFLFHLHVVCDNSRFVL